MLSARDPLDPPPRRILVAGVSGVGKTTLARAIAARTGLPHTEIDALRHGTEWVPRPSFEADVELVTRAERWITEWQYREVRQLLAERADTVVWIDLPITVTMNRVIRRTFRRRLRREILWNGNIEGPLLSFFTDRDHIIRWAWRTRNSWRKRVPDVALAHPELRIVRLRRTRDVRDFLAKL